MCGHGTVTVSLPGLNVLPLGARNPDDSVTLPDGCRIYALLVSGYERNKAFNELTFYTLAKWVAEHGGYVHYAWWNNLLKEYMGGPLHDVEVTIPLLGTFRANPGGLIGVHAAGFAPGDFGLAQTFPKALPEEDHQFQADAKLLLAEIRRRNPDAIIIVAGHSMGGEAVARLGSDTTATIDLLAPIDPVGNRTRPIGQVTNHTYNWTRWRAARGSWNGYRQADCIRTGPFPAPCRDFDPRIFHVEYRCAPNGVGSFLDAPPAIPSRAPGICRGPWVDPGTRRVIGSRVRHLVHRWQKETLFPFDYNDDQLFTYQGGDTTTSSGYVVRAQRGLGENGLLESDPNKTCANPAAEDPRDSTIMCNPGDGHGEIVGFRGFDSDAGGAIPVGVLAQDWPGTAAGRRQMLNDMVTPGEWEHQPRNPDLDLVVYDLLQVAQTILDQSGPGDPEDDTAPPITAATLVPGANEAGWHNTDPLIALNAADEGGSGVREISHLLSGAQTGGSVTSGDSAEETVTAEGITTLTYFARDNDGNAETPRTLDVMLDKTSPEIVAVPDIAPNAHGWNNTDVLVHFPASDALSGLVSASPDVVVSTEGASQEIVGEAVDRADNTASAGAVVSLDKTAPQLAIAAPDDGRVYLLRERVPASYECTDALSGVAECIGSVSNGLPIDTASVGHKAFTVGATDAAQNGASRTAGYSVQYAFSGFFKPTVPLPGVNDMMAGKVVTLLYQLRDAAGAVIADASSLASVTSAPVACGVPEPVQPESPASYSNLFNQRMSVFVINWKTDASWTGCRVLQVRLADGTVHSAMYRFAPAQWPGPKPRTHTSAGAAEDVP